MPASQSRQPGGPLMHYVVILGAVVSFLLVTLAGVARVKPRRARLIAAAPELLALLRDWVETVDAHVRNERDDIIEDATTLASAAQALLAKIDRSA